MSLEILTTISKHLSLPPFSKPLSVVQLDASSTPQLLEILSLVSRQINPQIKDIDGITDLLVILNCEFTLPETPKDILQTLAFLLDDLPSHQTRFYLSRFLRPIPVPQEYHQDVIDLQTEIENLQQEFKATHQYFLQTRVDTSQVKKDIKEMDEEKVQVLARMARLKSRICRVPRVDLLLEKARMLRNEVDKGLEFQERIGEEELVSVGVERRYQTILDRLASVKV
jgi:intraflagellar transport protein 81